MCHRRRAGSQFWDDGDVFEGGEAFGWWQALADEDGWVKAQTLKRGKAEMKTMVSAERPVGKRVFRWVVFGVDEDSEGIRSTNVI